jgi:hypothetical protein
MKNVKNTINNSTNHTTTTTAPGMIVHFAGSWFNAAESVDLVCAPRLRTDDTGQLWARVGDEEEEQRAIAERLSSLPLVVVAAETEVFIIALDDYDRQM